MLHKKTALQSIIFFIHRVLIKVFPYFPCCASCGEIKKPLKRRFCSSLSFSSPVSILLPISDITTLQQDISLLNRHCSWLHNIIIATTHENFLLFDDIKKYSSTIPLECFIMKASSSSNICSINLLSEIQHITNLCEHFILCSGDIPFQHSLDPLDFFTPNGIPLFRLQKSNDTSSLFKGYSLYEKNIAFTREGIRDLEKKYFLEREVKGTIEKVIYELFTHRYSLPVFYSISDM